MPFFPLAFTIRSVCNAAVPLIGLLEDLSLFSFSSGLLYCLIMVLTEFVLFVNLIF